ncbi:MAG: bifunctional demethylmenaquinone methyltransferase/2-methoxy-6-polyprenyl-1,4-benzoquinol methylase [Bacteroidetes bacterium GWF2_40_14]|nr:MAG: bifunctional demethylmenaquinone methyltransferase/2-methoxy-6-polyprenyl-1,4-benzoquinol methylase [Bacteroidetes bacterium GWF2_40_14]
MDNALQKDRESVSSMFNNIASKYDFLNHLLSLGIDKIWRRKLLNFVKVHNPEKVLDLACGTGDMTIALYKSGFEVVGADIAEKMLDVARFKSSRISSGNTPPPVFILASADSIPMSDNSFDSVTITFGIRNFEDRKSSLKEIIRVLRKGGYLSILEFATPRNCVWRGLFNLYFLKILPLIGRFISKDMKAYTYLPESVKSFPQYGDLCKEITDEGFTDVHYKSLTGGVAVLYTARKGVK